MIQDIPGTCACKGCDCRVGPSCCTNGSYALMRLFFYAYGVTSNSAIRLANDAPCISRSNRVPWTLGRGKLNLTTRTSGKSYRFKSETEIPKACATRPLSAAIRARSNSAASVQNISMVIQNGPEFLERILCVMSASLVMRAPVQLSGKRPASDHPTPSHGSGKIRIFHHGSFHWAKRERRMWASLHRWSTACAADRD